MSDQLYMPLAARQGQPTTPKKIPTFTGQNPAILRAQFLFVFVLFLNDHF